MGQVNLTNVTGATITIIDFTINNSSLIPRNPQGEATINSGSTYYGFYDQMSYQDFVDMELNIEIQLSITLAVYHINLSRNHFFGGGEFHYPGEGSDVNFILTGLDSSFESIRLKLAYGKNDLVTGAHGIFTYDDDSKDLQRVYITDETFETVTGK